MSTLERLDQLVEELKDNSSTNDKKEIMKKFPECKNIIVETYNPYQKFFVTSAQLEKQHHLCKKIMETPDIFALLNVLSSRVLTGHEAISQCNWFINYHLEYERLIKNIIDRDLKCRIAVKTINAVWPKAIPEFSVSLAKRYEDYEDKIDFDTDEWLASRKFDGIRITAFVRYGEVIYFTRRGHQNDNLSNLDPVMLDLIPPGHVLDGEICVVDAEGNENFSKAQSQVSKKDFTIPHPIYKVFDFLTLEEFQAKKSTRRLSIRLTQLTGLLGDRVIPIHPVAQRLIKSRDDLERALLSSASKGWEGLILRKNVGYQGKRSWDMLKVKKFFEAEFVVEDVIFDNLRFVENGKEVTQMMLSSVSFEYKGNTVSVGSGFSKKQRIHFYKKPEEIIGKTITVKYFEESRDKEGNYSLRFPTIKTIHGDKREV